MNELRAIQDFPGYSVSADGQVWSSKTNRFLRQWTQPFGYKTVCLSQHNAQKTLHVHRLVAAAFIGPPPSPDAVVCHLDNDPKNNSVSNLSYSSQAGNIGMAHASGRGAIGERVASSKLTAEQVVAIRSAKASGRSTIALAHEYGVSNSLIKQIIARKWWKHL